MDNHNLFLYNKRRMIKYITGILLFLAFTFNLFQSSSLPHFLSFQYDGQALIIGRYGLLDASGSWARLIAQSITSSSSSDKVNCSNYDLSKYTCRASKEGKTESVDVSISGNGSGSLSWGAQNIVVSYAGGRDKVTIVIKTPFCVSNDNNICAKSFVTSNKPIINLYPIEIYGL